MRGTPIHAVHLGAHARNLCINCLRRFRFCLARPGVRLLPECKLRRVYLAQLPVRVSRIFIRFAQDHAVNMIAAWARSDISLRFVPFFLFLNGSAPSLGTLCFAANRQRVLHVIAFHALLAFCNKSSKSCQCKVLIFGLGLSSTSTVSSYFIR